MDAVAAAALSEMIYTICQQRKLMKTDYRWDGFKVSKAQIRIVHQLRVMPLSCFSLITALCLGCLALEADTVSIF